MYNIILMLLGTTILSVKKTVIIAYSVRDFVDLGIQHSMRIHHNVICGLSSRCTIFLGTQNVCFDFFYKFEIFFIRRKIERNKS